MKPSKATKKVDPPRWPIVRCPGCLRSWLAAGLRRGDAYTCKACGQQYVVEKQEAVRLSSRRCGEERQRAMNSCASEGIIQCFIDGELPAPELRRVASHLSGCDLCAKAERAARLEDGLLSSLFAPDGFAAVPTVRLWAGVVTALGETRLAARCEP